MANQQFSGIVIGGPMAGQWHVSESMTMHYRVQKEPVIAMMYDVGTYRYNSIAIGDQTISYWTDPKATLLEVLSDLIETYGKYHDLCD